MTEWQTMETAPKDGKPILLWLPTGDPIVGRWDGIARNDWVETWEGMGDLDPIYWAPIDPPKATVR